MLSHLSNSLYLFNGHSSMVFLPALQVIESLQDQCTDEAPAPSADRLQAIPCAEVLWQLTDV